MIVIIRKKSFVFIMILLVLSAALLGININRHDSAPVANVPSSTRVVMLDPGHGGEDPGAVSDYSGIKEKDINLSIALRVRELLEKENFKVVMTRSEDRLEYQPGTSNVVRKREQDLTRRKKMMDDGGANIVVSIHLNKFDQTQYFGSQTFFPPNSPESQKLAISIQSSIKELVDPNNKREALVKKEPIIILKNARTTTAIVECGFLSNSEEEKKLASKEYQEKLAVAIQGGIKKYFEGK